MCSLIAYAVSTDGIQHRRCQQTVWDFKISGVKMNEVTFFNRIRLYRNRKFISSGLNQ